MYSYCVSLSEGKRLMWETLSGEDVRKRGQGRMMRVYFQQVHFDTLEKLLNETLDH